MPNIKEGRLPRRPGHPESEWERCEPGTAAEERYCRRMHAAHRWRLVDTEEEES